MTAFSPEQLAAYTEFIRDEVYQNVALARSLTELRTDLKEFVAAEKLNEWIIMLLKPSLVPQSRPIKEADERIAPVAFRVMRELTDLHLDWKLVVKAVITANSVSPQTELTGRTVEPTKAKEVDEAEDLRSKEEPTEAKEMTEATSSSDREQIDSNLTDDEPTACKRANDPESSSSPLPASSSTTTVNPSLSPAASCSAPTPSADAGTAVNLEGAPLEETPLRKAPVRSRGIVPMIKPSVKGLVTLMKFLLKFRQAAYFVLASHVQFVAREALDPTKPDAKFWLGKREVLPTSAAVTFVHVFTCLLTGVQELRRANIQVPLAVAQVIPIAAIGSFVEGYAHVTHASLDPFSADYGWAPGNREDQIFQKIRDDPTMMAELGLKAVMTSWDDHVSAREQAVGEDSALTL